MSQLADLFAPRVTAASSRIRWGAAWFVVLMAALWWSVPVLAGVLAAVAAVAAWQAASALSVDRLLASAVTAAAVAAAAIDVRLVGLTVIASAVGSLVIAVLMRGGRDVILTRTGALVGAWLLPAVAGSSTVVAADRELGSAVILVWALVMYDAGVYLVGADTRVRVSGQIAGLIGAAAVVFTAVQLAVPPLEPDRAWRFTLLLLVALPLGPALVRWFGHGEGWAVRRLDSAIVAAPAWAWATELVIG